MTRARRPETLWASLLLAGVVIEAVAVRGHRRESTLSHFTRKVFRVHTGPGRAVFVITWSAFAAWFQNHIITEESS